MAKSSASEELAMDDRRTAEELKKELMKLVKGIVEDDDRTLETYEEATRIITDLKDARNVPVEKGSSLIFDQKVKNHPRSEKEELSTIEKEISTPKSVSIPKHFICTLSSEIMRDPVILTTGETYERSYIQEWLSSGKRTCPRTQQVLATTILTPNLLVRSMISQWCSAHGVDLQPASSENPDTDCLITCSERRTLSVLLAEMSSPSRVGLAVKSLRELTKRSRSFRALAGADSSVIPQLLIILSGAGDDLELREDAVTALLNLSIHDANKKRIGESYAVPLLIQSMNSGGTINTPGNAAAALFTLSALDSNKAKIGELGAMPPLVELLESGSPGVKKDAASAIFNLCVLNENKIRAVKAGTVDACLAEIADSVSSTILDESLALLALLSANQEAAEEVADGGGVPLLLKIMREKTSAKNMENAVVVLFAVSSCVRTKLKEVAEEETMHATISKLANCGTSRAMRKAAGIMEKLNRIMHSTHYSC